MTATIELRSYQTGDVSIIRTQGVRIMLLTTFAGDNGDRVSHFDIKVQRGTGDTVLKRTGGNRLRLRYTPVRKAIYQGIGRCDPDAVNAMIHKVRKYYPLPLCQVSRCHMT